MAVDQAEADAQARQGYDRMAQRYTDHVALEMTVPSVVRSMLDAFADQVHKDGAGRVADIGCGPGHVTGYLAERGVDIFGVDNSPELLAIARASHPSIRFASGQFASLPIGTGELQAAVCKHALIHTPAELVSAALAELARVISPNGLLFLSFFGAATSASHGQPFDHAVTTAYELDVDIMAGLLAHAGFAEEVRVVQQPRANERQLPHGIFFARRQNTTHS